MFSAQGKPIPDQKNLTTLRRCALILKWVFRRAGLRALANLALAVVLYDVAFHIHSEIAKDVIGFACLFLIYRPLVYLLMAVVLLVKFGPGNGATESQGGQSPCAVESQNDPH